MTAASTGDVIEIVTSVGVVIIVAGHLRVATAERSQYLDAVADVAVQARQAAGCHDFVQSADPIDPNGSTSTSVGTTTRY